MGRRIVSGVALAALVVALSACKMSGGLQSPFASSKHEAAPVAHAGGGHDEHGGGRRHCVPGHDCTACYRSEADRDMGRCEDDLPPGGCCMPCGH